ncbi:MAG: hypothetical protein WC238_00810 [Parcubacteria group bacterium]|jgi:hypothetical protein
MKDLRRYIIGEFKKDSVYLKKEIKKTERNATLVRSGKSVSFMVVVSPHPRIAYDKGITAEDFYGKTIKEAKENAAKFKEECSGSIKAVYAVINETRAKIILPKKLWKGGS